MHQRMEFPPAVVVGVEEEGLEEEQQDVREKRRGEHAHQVVRELRIQDDEHERQERSERRGQRERDGEELRELVGEPVVSHIPGLVADRLDDEREDRDGEDERREQQVQLRDRPDRDAAPDDGKPSGRRPPRRACPSAWPCSRASSFSPARLSDADGRGLGSLLSLAHCRRRGPQWPREHHECGDSTEKDQQSAVHQGVHHHASLIGCRRPRASRRPCRGPCGCIDNGERKGSPCPCTTRPRGTGRPRSRGSVRLYPRCRTRSGACVTKGERSGPMARTPRRQTVSRAASPEME